MKVLLGSFASADIKKKRKKTLHTLTKNKTKTTTHDTPPQIGHPHFMKRTDKGSESKQLMGFSPSPSFKTK